MQEIALFRQMNFDTESKVSNINIFINKKEYSVPDGITAAAAVLINLDAAIRINPVGNQKRAPYCMMGVCFECLMEIDGVPNRQGCLVGVREGMQINIFAPVAPFLKLEAEND